MKKINKSNKRARSGDGTSSDDEFELPPVRKGVVKTKMKRLDLQLRSHGDNTYTPMQ